jgi:alkanesulfonate monooxygenase SsuD/methylene tetrahydromethanopterin reductase-like flavin-dependent oxidoreductase (luciferase family)
VLPEHPFRFGVEMGGATSRADLIRKARQLEELGYGVLLMGDHFFDSAFLGPFAVCVTAAEATRTLRVGSYVLGNDFYHKRFFPWRR